MMTMTPARHSRNTGSHNTSSNNHNNSTNSSRSMLNMQGVLWKRRDIFRNRWRPRWFVLHPDQRVLTYYLLANREAGVGPQQVVSGGSSSSTSTPRRRGTACTTTTPAYNSTPSSTVSVGSPATTADNNNNNRRRTFSESSTLTANTIDCDVVPRGTIYLLGSTVEGNEALTRPQEGLYTLTITDHEAGTHCHLATHDAESREEWIVRIRRVCQDEVVQQQQPGSLHPVRNSSPTTRSRTTRSKRKGRTPASPKTPNCNSEEERTTATAVRNEIDVEDDSSGSNGSQQVSLLRNDDSNNDADGINIGVGSFREKEIWILIAPLVLYKVLTMASLFRLAALSFAVTTTVVSRWVLIHNLSKVVRFLKPDGDIHGSNRATMPIGHGSICCRFTAQFRTPDTEMPSIVPQNILVQSLAKAIRQQPFLASKKHPLLPRIYSTDVVFLDLANKNNNTPSDVWVTNADEKSLSEIGDCFTVAQRPRGQQQQSPNLFLQQIVGPLCRIVMTSDTKNDNSGDGSAQQEIHLDLNLTECPVTVLISATEESLEAETRKTKTFHVSVNIQSTDVGACRKFAENFQQLLRSSEMS